MKKALVVTTIGSPGKILQQLAEVGKSAGWDFYIAGDRKSPPDFHLDGSHYYDLAAQKALPFQLAGICPEASYTRKNIAYLLAIQAGCEEIIETDDDNYPIDGFATPRERKVVASSFQATDKADKNAKKWVNVYAHFGQPEVWPRGLPLDAVRNPLPGLALPSMADCPIQQGLADENPDVDAVYRLLKPLPISFEQRDPVVLPEGVWCPFNSQNTTWFRDAFPLLYLPATCSFRMTDIWRSFVAQRVAWAQGWKVLFHAPTVAQERNEHNLMRDFEDEVSGYLNNDKIAEHLDRLSLTGRMDEDLRLCHRELVKMGLTQPLELTLLDAWLADVAQLGLTF